MSQTIQDNLQKKVTTGDSESKEGQVIGAVPDNRHMRKLNVHPNLNILDDMQAGRQLDSNWPFEPKKTVTSKQSEKVRDKNGQPIEVSKVTI